MTKITIDRAAWEMAELANQLNQTRVQLNRLLSVARRVRHKKGGSALEFATALAELDEVIDNIETGRLYHE